MPPNQFKMALYYDLTVYKDVYRLALVLFEATGHFAREYKYTLGQDMKRDVLTLVRYLYRANKATSKREHLEAFLDDFELLKVEVRLSTDLHLITIKKQAELAVLMDAQRQLEGNANMIRYQDQTLQHLCNEVGKVT